MSQLGIFCTVARTEMIEKCGEQSDEVLQFVNYVIKHAHNLGIGTALEVIEGGSFSHDQSPEFKFAKEVSKAIRREIKE